MDRKYGWRDYLGEIIGVFFIIFFGDGYVAIAVLYGAGDGLMLAGFAWAFAVAFAIYLGGVTGSGAHYNPAVTLAFALRRGFPWSQVVPYWIAQIVGGFLGAAAVWFINVDQIKYWLAQNAGGSLATPPVWDKTTGVIQDLGAMPIAKIFSPYAPNWGVVPVVPSTWVIFLGEILTTAVLLFGIFALIDEEKQPNFAGGLTPVLIGMIVGMLVMMEAPITMTSMNAARDLGPRIWIALMGAGRNAFPGPIPAATVATTLATLVGGVLGAYFYDYFVRPE